MRMGRGGQCDRPVASLSPGWSVRPPRRLPKPGVVRLGGRTPSREVRTGRQQMVAGLMVPDATTHWRRSSRCRRRRARPRDRAASARETSAKETSARTSAIRASAGSAEAPASACTGAARAGARSAEAPASARTSARACGQGRQVQQNNGARVARASFFPRGRGCASSLKIRGGRGTAGMQASELCVVVQDSVASAALSSPATICVHAEVYSEAPLIMCNEVCLEGLAARPGERLPCPLHLRHPVLVAADAGQPIILCTGTGNMIRNFHFVADGDEPAECVAKCWITQSVAQPTSRPAWPAHPPSFRELRRSSGTRDASGSGHCGSCRSWRERRCSNVTRRRRGHRLHG